MERHVVDWSLDPLARSDREGELQNWLEARDIADAWSYRPTW